VEDQRGDDIQEDNRGLRLEPRRLWRGHRSVGLGLFLGRRSRLSRSGWLEAGMQGHKGGIGQGL